jgi:hypothetical protein
MINFYLLIQCLITLESGGDDNAVNGDAVGCLQLTSVFVDEANRIVEVKFKKKPKKKGWSGASHNCLYERKVNQYFYDDRYDRELSIRMAMVVLPEWERQFKGRYGKCTPRDVAGMFRSGFTGYQKDQTKHGGYLDKFEKLYKNGE